MSSEEGQVEAILLMAGFTEVDENNDGYLTVEELRNALKNTELEKFVDLIVLKADADQNGKIDYRGTLFVTQLKLCNFKSSWKWKKNIWIFAPKLNIRI